MMWRHARYNAATIHGERRAIIDMARNRLAFLVAFFCICFFMVAFRITDLSIVQGTLSSAHEEGSIAPKDRVKAIAARRGDVYDRNGFLVGTTLKVPSLYVDPSLVSDPNVVLKDLKRVISGLDEGRALAALSADNRFGWVHYNLTPAQQAAVLELGNPALGFEYDYHRVYPQGPLFAHMLGYTDRDGLGLAGIERSYDDVLAKGQDVHLSVDLRLQHAVKREVARAITEFDAKAGAGLVMDVKSGALLAAVSLPDFDLNEAGDAVASSRFNRLSLGVYELGSMFKIFSTAALLDLHHVDMGYEFDARQPIRIGRYTINDYHAQKRILTVPEVFMHSSNIGSALMGQKIGAEALRNFYADLGLMQAMQFDIKEVGAPLLPDVWRESTVMTVSYGHGIATTPLQMSAAVASIVNGGTLVTPTLIKRESVGAIRNDVRVISEKTSKQMRQLMRLVVTKGTGKGADVPGYSVGGKTGTAEKSVNGRYDRSKLISSFVGAFPMDDPRYVIMVMVDEPKGNKESFGYATAGWVAAPAVSRIVKSMASIMGMPAVRTPDAPDISDALLPYLQDQKKGGKRLVSY